MIAILETAEKAVMNQTVYAVIVTSYIWLTMFCIFMMYGPKENDPKETMAWFDFFRVCFSAISISALFFCISGMIRSFDGGLLIKAVIFGAMITGSFVLTHKIRVKEASEDFVLATQYVLSPLATIIGIINVITTMMK